MNYYYQQSKEIEYIHHQCCDTSPYSSLIRHKKNRRDKWFLESESGDISVEQSQFYPKQSVLPVHRVIISFEVTRKKGSLTEIFAARTWPQSHTSRARFPRRRTGNRVKIRLGSIFPARNVISRNRWRESGIPISAGTFPRAIFRKTPLTENRELRALPRIQIT